MSGSAIPAAWSALTAVWQAAAPTLQVVRGPNYDPDPDFLAVGWDRTDQAAISFTVTPMGGAVGRRNLEVFDITSLLSSAYDANSIDRVVTDLFATYQVLAAALATDPTLGGAVMEAVTTSGDVTPFLTETGAVMDLRIVTHLQAAK